MRTDQIHAELCYAESMLLKAVLTFTEDETLMSFVKGGMKIRSCYQSYKYKFSDITVKGCKLSNKQKRRTSEFDT